MHRSGLSKRDLAKIEEGIADACSVQEPILVAADPAWIEHAYLPEITKKGVAWVCLADAAEMLTETRYALVQATAYRVAYDRGLDPPDTQLSPSLFMAQFHMDDTVLRLYATAESVAECVTAFYDAELTQALRAVKKPRASQFKNVCNAIAAVRLPGGLAVKMLSTGDASETGWVTKYRNAWMHGQRMRMTGTGLRFGRNKVGSEYEPRAKRTTTAKGTPIVTLEFRSHDPAETSIAEAMDVVTKVFRLLLDLIVTCHETLAADLPSSGPNWKRK